MIYGRPYDIHGHFLNQDDDKIVGLPVNQIMKVPRRICLVRGKSKSRPVVGALRGKLITDMILTEAMAYRILNEENL